MKVDLTCVASALHIVHRFFSSVSVRPEFTTGEAFRVPEFLVASWRGATQGKSIALKKPVVTSVTLQTNPTLVRLQNTQLPAQRCKCVNAPPLPLLGEGPQVRGLRHCRETKALTLFFGCDPVLVCCTNGRVAPLRKPRTGLFMPASRLSDGKNAGPKRRKAALQSLSRGSR